MGRRKAKILQSDSLMSESAFTRLVIALAKRLGWHPVHHAKGMTSKGRWVTAMWGDGKGFPDLFLLRGHRSLYVELKAEDGRLKPEQEEWLCRLAFAGHETAVWRPSDWDEIKEILA
jgi:hypothetical protein